MSESFDIQARKLPSNPTEIADSINRAFQSSDIVAICLAIGKAIRVHSMSDVAKKAGMSRPSVYRAFGGQQHPNLMTLLRVLDAMGFQLKVKPRRGKRLASTRERPALSK